MAENPSEAPALKIRRIAGRIGAEILDVRLRDALTAPQIRAMRQALLAHRVIFFRDQVGFDDQAQEAFTGLLGDLVPHPTERVRAGTLGILELDAASGNARADQWHTDVTFVDAPPRYSILRAVRIPPYGGDTTWANTVAAYQSLSPELQRLAESLWALHTNQYDYAAQYVASTAAERRHYEEVFSKQVYEAEQPVVRIHPETGEKALLLGQFVQRFVGQSHADSQLLFTLFQNHVTRLENTVRWSWRENDVAIWDNQSTRHYAIYDYDGQDRTVRRTTVAGEVVVGVDGRRARTIKRPDMKDAAE
jgi:taurine dioxygenase